MILVDARDGSPTDFIDGGSTASPPSDTYDSMFMMSAQVATGVITPTFTAVESTEVINPGAGQILYVKVGATTVQITMVIPGNQRYSGTACDDLVLAGLSNTERVFYLPDLLTDPAIEVITVAYSPTTNVTAALIKVN